MARRKEKNVIDLNQNDFYPVPSFIIGSMCSKKDPVLVGEFWAPELYEYVSDERMTESMRRDFFSRCAEAILESKSKPEEEGRA